MKGIVSDNLVSFYFSVEEPRRWAIRTALRVDGDEQKADDLLYIEHYYRDEYKYNELSKSLGIDKPYRVDAPEARYKEIVQYNPDKNEVVSIKKVG